MSTEAHTIGQSQTTAKSESKKRPKGRRRVLLIGAAIVVLAMALDTKVVQIGSSEDIRQAGFSAQNYGQATFPKIQKAIEERAVKAPELAAAIIEDRKAAAGKFGVSSASGPVFAVSLTGIAADKPVSGVYTLAVAGMPPGIRVRIQTGPAINGTELRDATGTISFGQFKNQIEYQNAGSALNNEMKTKVLASIDTKTLAGKTVSVVGAFRLINPKNWLITPVRLEVQ